MKVVKAWFKQVTNVLRPDGTFGGTRFNNGDEPNEDTFNNLLDSVPNFKEIESKANLSSGADRGEEQGLVVLANNTQAKTNIDQLTDRSLVVQPHQLPTIKAFTPVDLESVDTSALTQPEKDVLTASGLDPDADATLNTTITSGITTRNNYQIRFSNTILRWLSNIVKDKLLKPGGTTKQVLTKLDNGDFNTAWSNYGYNSTSNTTATIGLGVLSFNVGPNFDYKPRTRVSVTSDTGQVMEGTTIDYSGGVLELLIDYAPGTGTFSTWTIGLGSTSNLLDTVITGSVTTVNAPSVLSVNIQFKKKNEIVYLWGTITMAPSVTSGYVVLFADTRLKSISDISVTVSPTNGLPITSQAGANISVNNNGIIGIQPIGSGGSFNNAIYKFIMSYPSV